MNHIAESYERCEANVGCISSILLESEDDSLVNFPFVEVGVYVLMQTPIKACRKCGCSNEACCQKNFDALR